ncbi:Retrovirus-related Pol polyprotein [Larimichthys crocea]|uniref:Gypsy retrotransposon integrase-like protein 1 n=1 Tax=Larimichthys crocea TaxID=215358 RepID=A0A6G0HD36_LARCR|nr:Retrovirus-related Pol polyprotein [Larimichthys crocea]
MPFGIISASEIYHRAMDNMLEGLEGVRCYIDDLVIWGSTLQEHNDRLAKVLQRISDHGLKLNRAKCQFCVQEMTFLGDKLSGEGIEPDDRKIKAILSMPRPRDKKGVLRVMGMINFIGKFIPNLSAKTSALRELLRDSTEFKWTTRNEREWNALKEALTKSPVLAYYDPAKRQKISTDASKDGLGAVLLQAEGDSWKPVAYASRSMTTTETKYAQIEKECLGLAYGLERFHCYVYGLPTFTVETDHRPLVSIIKKNLNDMSPRIQRLIMKLQRYDFELIYTPGKHLVLADALSRAPVMSDVTSTEKEIENHINMIVESLPVSDVKAKQISEELDKDKELQAVINNMLSGWPRGSCPKYYHIRAELSVANGLLLRDNRIVIPHSLRPEILRQLHEGHLGIEKCKRRARGAVYWPGINKDIEDMVGKCETCNKYQSKQAREPMMIPDLPTAAWEKVGTDLFHCNGKDYLLVIDYYSNFPEIALLSNTTASTVIGHVKSIFARHGIPKTVVSDNGPCYNCKEWQQFANHYGFSHVTSSPQHAQANGKSEKGVHIIKQILKKTTDSKSDPYLALLSYRAAPLECGLSPAELLMNRKLRTTLPCYTAIKPNTGTQKKFKDMKWKQKQRYDKSTKPLSPLAKDDVVRIQDQDAWNRKATVLQEVRPRSYEVLTEEGNVLRRNRRSLLKTKETFTETDNDADGCNADAASSANSDEHLQVDTSDVQTELPVLRRSERQIKRPDKLNL